MSERKKVRPIAQMLEDPNKGITKTYGGWGALSKLWRIILRENNISGYRFWMLMDRFIKDPINRTKKNNNDHTDNRGNLNKEFSNPAMSWKVFLKGMRFMQFSKIRITIEAEHKSDGHISVHKTMVDLDKDLLIDDPVFVQELEKSHRGDPDVKNLPVPEDQEPVEFLDPHPDDDEEDAWK